MDLIYSFLPIIELYTIFISFGIRIGINSYAENKNELNNIKYGLNQARHVWVEREDIINSQNNLF
jgi:histidinol phosphatase-like PHP family hydrolase